MRKTIERQTDNPITVDITKLAAMLSCGEDTARKIAECAEARVPIGRRVLYSVAKVEKYIEAIAA